MFIAGIVMSDAEATLSPRRRFEDAANAGVLTFQRDPITGTAIFPPRLVAPRTGSLEPVWCTSKGVGAVHAVTVLHGRDGTRALALIDLDEGFRMLAIVLGTPPDEVGIGARVRMRMEHGVDDAYPVFELGGDAP